jgi:MFS family permease
MFIHKNIKILTWFNFLTDFRFYAPIAIIYFAKVTGSYVLGTSIFSIVAISSAFFEVPTGIVSDYIGRKNTVIFGSIASVLCVVLYAIGGSYWMLVFGAFMEGLSRAFYSGNNDALLHDTLSDLGKSHDYHVHYGKTHSMFQIAGASAAVIGGFVATWSFALLMWLSVIPQIIGLCLSFGIIEPKKRGGTSNIYSHFGQSIIYFIKNKKLRILSMTDIIGYASGEASYQFQTAFFGTLWPLWAIGLARTISGFAAAVSFYTAGKFVKKFREIPILIFGNLFGRIFNLIALFFVSLASPVLMSLTSLLFGTTTSAKSNLFQKEYTEDQRATMSSLNSLASNISFAIFALGVGFLADRIGGAKALIIINIIQFIPIFLYFKLRSYSKNEAI